MRCFLSAIATFSKLRVGFKRRFYAQLIQRSGLLKFVDMSEAEDGKVGPGLLIRLSKKASNSKEIKDLLQESQIRFGNISWQILSSAAHRAASVAVNDPKFAVSLLRLIPKRDFPNVHEGVLRAVLGCASRMGDLEAAKAVFAMIPFNIRNPTDSARLIYSGIGTQEARHLIVETVKVAQVVDLRVLGVFLKLCAKCHDIQLAQHVWAWGAQSRASTSDMRSLTLVTVQMLMVTGKGNLETVYEVWNDVDQMKISQEPEVIGAMLSVLASHGKKEEARTLFSNVPLSKVSAPMLASVLTAYSHCACASEAWELLQFMLDNQKGMIVGLNAFTVVVDAYARKGQFEKAFEVIEKSITAGFVPDSVMWMTFLSPCRRYGALAWAQKAFSVLQNAKSEEMRAAAYVVMSDVYRVCGDVVSSERMHTERIQRGLFKERGAVTTTVQGQTYTFHVNEVPSELRAFSDEIYRKLDEWVLWLSSQEVSTESIMCRHSEKLALAFAVLKKENHVILRKNLRICSSCHAASIAITRLEGIKISHWDKSRVHTMEDGKCSCGGFY